MTPAARIGLFMLVGLIILGVFIIKIEDIPVGERGDLPLGEVAGADDACGVGRAQGSRVEPPGLDALCGERRRARRAGLPRGSRRA